MDNRSLAARDLKVLWHPCTQMRDHEAWPPIPIRRGAGAWLEDYDGKRYLDAISSWWVNLFGHANPRINAAIRQQLDELEHVILAGFTHEPVVRLSERLLALAPAGLAHCFYASDGSSAVEIALKMSFHYWRNRGEHRARYINLANSYHGETLGALAVGDVSLYKEIYAPLLLEPITVPSPDCYDRDPGESCADYARRQFARMEEALARHAGEVCAVIVEPLVQCAGAMRMYDPVYLGLVRAACDRHRVHLIADEIAVGFGRTGTLFACEQGPISPDLLCLGKGLTGGYLPLSACLATDDIYQAFYGDGIEPRATRQGGRGSGFGDGIEARTTRRAFLHSHSYTGNVLACTAANAALDIFASEDVLGRNRALADHLAAATARFHDHPHVADVRQRGMIVALEMVKDRKSRALFPWEERRGGRVYRHALARGALLRPLGDVVYFMPPYVITPEEIDFLAEVAWEGIEVATRD